MSTDFNAVWYWIGGTEEGEWKFSMNDRLGPIGTSEALWRAGYIALLGRTSWGKPDSPPSDGQWRELDKRFVGRELATNPASI